MVNRGSWTPSLHSIILYGDIWSINNYRSFVTKKKESDLSPLEEGDNDEDSPSYIQ